MTEGPQNSLFADMWSAGVVLYEMLVLRMPFATRSLHELVNQIIHSPAPPLPGIYQVKIEESRKDNKK